MPSPLQLSAQVLQSLPHWLAHPDQVLPEALARLDPDAPWHALVQPVQALPPGAPALALPLLSTERQTAPAALAGGAWSAAAAASAQLSLSRLDRPLRDDGRVPIELAVRLDLQAQAGGHAAASVLAVAADAAWTQRLVLRWQQALDPAVPLGAALVDLLAHGAWPQDLAGLVACAQDPHWLGLQLAWDGQAQLGLQLRSTWDAVGWQLALDGASARLGLSLGLAGTLRAERDTQWQLSVTPQTADDGTPLLAVDLHDLRTRQRDAALTLSASADLSDLAAQAEQALQRASGAVEAALLDRLVRPGQAVVARLEALVAQAVDGPPAALAQVRDDLAQALDQALPELLADQALDAARLPPLLQALLQRLPVPAARLPALVEGAAALAQAQLQDALQALSTAWQAHSAPLRDTFLARLGALGAQFDPLPEAADAAQALALAREALQRYAAQRQRLQTALQQAQRQRLALTLAGRWQQQRADEAMVSLRLALHTPPSAAEQQLQAALCSGRLARLGPLLEAARADGSLQDAQGWLQASAQSLSEQRVSLDLPDGQIGSQSRWSRSLQIRTALGSGELIGGRAEAEVETAIAHRWKQRSARLGVQLALLTDAPGGALRLAVALDGGFVAEREGRATRQRVQALLDDLAQAGVVPRRDLGHWLGLSPAELDSADWRDLRLAWPLHLTPAQWQRFADQPPQAVDRVSLAALLPIFARRYARDALFSDDPVADLCDLAGGPDDEALLAWLRRFPERYVDRARVATEAPRVNIVATHSGGLADRGTRQYLIAQRLAATVLAPSRLQALARQAQQALDGLPAPLDPAAARAALDPLLQRMQQVLAPVALASETWLAIGLGGAADEPVAWPLVGFAAAMAPLAGLPVPPGFLPVLQWGEQTQVLA
ncbi:hypothetical protein KAK07_06430 [Ideonella sp. 4Y16]|uniref:hypothetical protein n=1 Tax=Ideonella alba TaxID=2824118 RepID=UPI001B37983D|nr:hypothetical protein [Ideonella alba]MBQ0942965.1 hypothetical protein [Ideonella alba]